jgi:hypothetical protein
MVLSKIHNQGLLLTIAIMKEKLQETYGKYNCVFHVLIKPVLVTFISYPGNIIPQKLPFSGGLFSVWLWD